MIFPSQYGPHMVAAWTDRVVTSILATIATIVLMTMHDVMFYDSFVSRLTIGNAKLPATDVSCFVHGVPLCWSTNT